MTTPVRRSGADDVCWLNESHAPVDAVDQAVYEVVADTATPRIDGCW